MQGGTKLRQSVLNRHSRVRERGFFLGFGCWAIPRERQSGTRTPGEPGALAHTPNRAREWREAGRLGRNGHSKPEGSPRTEGY